MAEIDDAELQRLQAAQALLDRMLKSPKTKRATEKLIKEHHPETVTSEDFEAPIVEEMRAIGKKVDTFLEAQTTRRQDEETAAAFSRLRADGYTDEGVEWIRKQMVERKIADPEAAAALYDKHHPPEPQRPASLTPASWGIGAPTEDKDLDLLFKDEEAWGDKEAAAFFDEIRKGQA